MSKSYRVAETCLRWKVQSTHRWYQQCTCSLHVWGSGNIKKTSPVCFLLISYHSWLHQVRVMGPSSTIPWWVCWKEILLPECLERICPSVLEWYQRKCVLSATLISSSLTKQYKTFWKVNIGRWLNLLMRTKGLYRPTTPSLPLLKRQHTKTKSCSCVPRSSGLFVTIQRVFNVTYNHPLMLWTKRYAYN